MIQELSSGAPGLQMCCSSLGLSRINAVPLCESGALVAELSRGDVAPEESFWNAIKEPLRHRPCSGSETSALPVFEGWPAAKLLTEVNVRPMGEYGAYRWSVTPAVYNSTRPDEGQWDTANPDTACVHRSWPIPPRCNYQHPDLAPQFAYAVL